jgi:ribonuclease-3
MLIMDLSAKDFDQLENKISYMFKNKKNLILAMTHSSFANENKNAKLQSNERLEFLGDAVLNIVISEYIYLKFANLTEGEMTKARASIVCEQSLMKCANNIGIGSFLMLGKGEELTGGRMRPSILSDAFEALIGAIYLDGGMKNAKQFILGQMEKLIHDSINGAVFMDFKTQLQEIIQKEGDSKIVYEIIDEKGPDHEKVFVAQVKVSDRVIGKGNGKSKKEAEQAAARVALMNR